MWGRKMSKNKVKYQMMMVKKCVKHKVKYQMMLSRKMSKNKKVGNCNNLSKCSSPFVW